MRRFVAALGTLTLGTVPVAAQPTVESARPPMMRWLALVQDGSADQAWAEASPFFHYRINEISWRDWVRAAAPHLKQSSERRELEFAVGHDEPPLRPLTWVRALYARNRPAGGRIFEQIILFQEPDRWRVAHYGSWMDDVAMVNGGSMYPVPFHLAYRGQRTFTDYPWWTADPRPSPAPVPAPRPANVANPRTFPKRPPPR